MSILFTSDSVELLKLEPCEFRRIYTLERSLELQYSHTDVVVLLENKERAMLEIIQGLLPEGSFVVQTQPTDLTFHLHMAKSGISSMDWLKKIIFMNFPDLPCGDFYCQKRLQPSNEPK
jgi:hypothetical protein